MFVCFAIIFPILLFRFLIRNLEHMNKKHSFFICDEEFAKNKEGIVKEMAEKIFTDFTCIYCIYTKKKEYPSFRSVQMHMFETGHTLMNPEYLNDYARFYDYSIKYQEILEKYKNFQPHDFAIEFNDDQSEEWEDEDKLEDITEEKENEPKVPKTKNELKKFLKSKFTKNHLGELVLPNNKIIGTKRYLRYYNQYYTNNFFQRNFYIKALENRKVISDSNALMVYNDLAELKKIYKTTIFEEDNERKKLIKLQNKQIQLVDELYNKKLLKQRVRKDLRHNYTLNKFFKDRNMVY